MTGCVETPVGGQSTAGGGMDQRPAWWNVGLDWTHEPHIGEEMYH